MFELFNQAVPKMVRCANMYWVNTGWLKPLKHIPSPKPAVMSTRVEHHDLVVVSVVIIIVLIIMIMIMIMIMVMVMMMMIIIVIIIVIIIIIIIMFFRCLSRHDLRGAQEPKTTGVARNS